MISPSRLASLLTGVLLAEEADGFGPSEASSDAPTSDSPELE